MSIQFFTFGYKNKYKVNFLFLSIWTKLYLSYDQGDFCASQCVKTMSERQ